MADRVSDIWGTRTPHAKDSPWPVRVDLHLEDGLAESDVDRWVQSACVLCSNGCACDIAVKDDRMVGIRGRAGDVVNHGRLGPKGLYGSWQWSHTDRLRRPLVRRGGELVESDWDTAMNLIVRRSRELLDEVGPLSHSFYTSGQLFLEEYYTLAMIGKAGLGTPHMDGNTRLCTATAAAAMKESFGSDGQPGSYTDIDSCDALFLFGHNMAETQTVLWTRVLDRLHGPDRPVIVAVDPRRTKVTEAAVESGGVHLAPLPGTNLALMNGLLRELITRGWVDHDYVTAHTRRLRRAGCHRGAVYPGAGGRDLPDRPGRAAACGRGVRHVRSGVVHRVAGFLPITPGHRGVLSGQQPAPVARADRETGLRRPADERAAHRSEHP